MSRRTRRQKKKKTPKQGAGSPRLEALEPRVLLSTLTVSPDGDLDEAMRDAESGPQAIEFHLGDGDASAPEEVAAAERRSELVFVDTGVENYQRLVEDLRAASPEGRTLEVFLLDSGRDGIEQISEILADYQGLDAIHIVSHGTAGAVQLGDSWLSEDTISSYEGSLSSWSESLSESADLLFYGCDLAAGESGQALVGQIAKLTAADVAASDDLTGAASLGGDWTLEHATGALETSVAVSDTAQAEWTGLLGTNLGTAIWAEKDAVIPQMSHWNGVGFDAEASTNVSAGTWRIMQGADAPTRDEKIVIGITDGGKISAMMWDGNDWATVGAGSLGGVSETYWWGADVAYESQSGDAVMVWNDDSKAAGEKLRFSVWDGNDWTAHDSILAYTGSEPQQLKLVADPHSDEMILVVSDSNADDHVLVWNGSSWGNAQMVDASGTGENDQSGISVAYEAQSGNAMVVYGKDNDPNLYYQIWNGSSWQPEASMAAPAGVTEQVAWTTLASDPNSDRIAVSVLTTGGSGADVWLSIWDGDGWKTPILAEQTAPGSISPGAAVAFESQSGQAIAVYGENGQESVRFRTWDATNGWSDEQIGPSIAGTPASVTLDSDPGSNQIMLSIGDNNADVNMVLWDGSGWGTPTEHETDTGETKNQPFVYLWAAASANVAPAADAGGPYTIAEGEGVLFDASGTTDANGDPMTYRWDLNNDGIYGDLTSASPNVGTSWSVLDSYGINDDGTYTIGLQVDDGAGGITTTTTTLTVTNVAPVITATGPSTVGEGSVYVLDLSAVDPGDDTIAKWSINWGDGNITTVDGSATEASHVYGLAGMTYEITVSAIDEDGIFTSSDLLTASDWNGYVLLLDGNTGDAEAKLGGAAMPTRPAAVAIGPDGDYYIASSGTNSIIRIDGATGTSSATFVSSASGGLSNPFGLAFGPDGNLYVASYNSGEVLRYDGSTGAFIDVFVADGEGGVGAPSNLEFGPDGMLYVTDWFSGKVHRFDAAGTYVDDFVDTGGFGVTDVAFGPNDTVYVSNANANQVYKYDSDGVLLGSLSAGSAYQLEFGPDGSLYVSRWSSDAIERFNVSTMTSLGIFADATDELDGPWGIEFTPDQQVKILPHTAPSAQDDATPQNDAPALSGGNDLTAIDEDPVSNPGTLVSDLLAGHVTDADTGDPAGIAVIGVDDANGTWEYTTDGGSTWTAFGAVDTSNARLLAADANASVRFVPNADWNGTVANGITFHAWDQTSGAAGGTADLSVATVLDQFETVSYQANDGTTHWTGFWTEASDDGAAGTGNVRIEGGKLRLDNLDGGGLESITRAFDLSGATSAVLTLDYNGWSEGGTDRFAIEVSNDGGASWVLLEDVTPTLGTNFSGSGSYDLGGAVSFTSDMAVRFSITQGFAGTTQHVLFDNVQIEATGMGTGGSTAFSAASASSSITVAAVNDAPLRTAGTVATLTVAEDSGLTPLGLAGLGYGPGGGGDEAGQNLTYEVTVIPDPNFFGKIYLADGSTQVTTGSYTLAELQGMQFEPAPNANGGPSFFEFRVVDDGGMANGGSDRVTESLQISITPVNDPPTAVNDTATVNEGESVTFSLTGNDSDPDSALNLGSIVITSLPANGTLVDHGDGTFTYTHDGTETLGDSFSYTIQDADGATSNVASVTLTINPVNDPPSVAYGEGNKTYVEDAPPLVIDALATVADPDSDDFAGGTLTFDIAANSRAGDQLGIRNQGTGAGQVGVSGSDVTYGGIVVGTWSGGGDQFTPLVVTFNAAADASVVEAVARNVTFENTSQTPATSSRTLRMIVTDGDGGTSSAVTKTISAISVNDTPIGGDDTYTTSEEVPLNVAAPGVLANDVDLDGNPITAQLETGPANGTLVLNADGSFTYTPDAEFSGTDSFTYVVRDASATPSAPVTVTIDVTPVNDAPVAVDDTATVNEGESVTFSLTGNDTDPDSTLNLGSIVITSSPANGSLVDHGDGTFTYTHDGTETLGDSFSYTIQDASGATSNVASVTITVGTQNDPPTAVDDTATVNEGQSVTFSLTGNDTDPDSTLNLGSIVVTSAPANGTLVDHGDGTFTYTHDGTETLGDSFSYTIQDASGATSNVASVTITVGTQNDPPTAVDDTATVNEGQSVTFSLTGNDTDPDSTLNLGSIVVTSAPANGTLVDHGDGTFTYTHDGTETLGDSFSYTVQDTSGATSNIASVTLTVLPQNDAPTAVDDTATVNEGQSVTFSLTGNDTDPDSTLNLGSIVVTSAPANGTLVDHGDGTFTYTHDGTETLGDSFSYTIQDASGATSNVASVTITVGTQNDPPTAVDDTATVNEGQSVTFSLTGNDTDPDSTLNLGSIVVTSAPANGTLVDHGDGTFTYTHDGTETLGDSFSYTVQDTSGATSNIASVTLTVLPQNDAPTAVDDTATVNEGQSVTFSLTGNDTDPDSTLNLGSIVITSSPANGSLVDHGDGTFTYTHDGTETLGDSFSYTIQDASGATSNVASVTITVGTQNDPPTAVDDTATVNEGQSVTFSLTGNDTDPDSTLNLGSIVVTSAPANGTLVDHGDGTFTYTHDGTETLGDSFSYTVQDTSGATSNIASVTLTVLPQNDAPTAVDDTATVNEGESVTFSLTGNDTDPDSTLNLGSIVITSSPANGTLVDHGDGTFTYTHDGTETLGDSFSYTIQDASGATSNVASVTITVGTQNDPPTAVDDTATVNEGQSVTFSLTGNDTDPDSTLNLGSIVITSSPANGSLVDHGDGTFTYTHDGTETLGDSFSYTIQDASGATSNVASVTLTVLPQNDTPTAVDDTATVNEGQSVTFSLTGNDTDPDSTLNLGSIVITSSPANGSLVDHGDGTFTYTHDGTETLGDSFSYTVQDTSGATSNVASVTLTVLPQNDAPTAVDDTATVNEGQSVTFSLTGNDTDPDSTLNLGSIVITSSPANGTLVDHGDGTFTYTHDGTETLGDSFSYTIQDASGATSNIASVTLTILPQNDAPLIADQPLSVDENSSVGAMVGTVVASDPDVGDSLAFAIRSGNVGGAFAIDPTTGDVFVANPAALDFEAMPEITLVVEAEDVEGVRTSATVTVTIRNLNEAIELSGPETLSLVAGKSVVLSALDGNAISVSDLDGADAPLEVTLVADGGLLTLGSMEGITIVAGSGAGDTTLTFRGSASDVGAALEGLVFAAGESPGAASIAVTVADLAPGGHSVEMAVGIDLKAAAEPEPPTEPPTEPEPEPEPPVEPNLIDVTVPPPATPAPDAPETATTGPARTEAGPEDATVDAVNPVQTLTALYLDPSRGEDRTSPEWQRKQTSLETAFPALVTSPASSEVRIESDRDARPVVDLLRPAFIHPDFFASLDQMRREVLGEAAGADATEWMAPALEGMTLAATTGLLAAVLRSGSLMAMGLSSVPLWKRADPLTVLSLSKEERRDLENSLRAAGSGEQDLAAMLDGDAEHDESEDDDTPEEPA